MGKIKFIGFSPEIERKIKAKIAEKLSGLDKGAAKKPAPRKKKGR